MGDSFTLPKVTLRFDHETLRKALEQRRGVAGATRLPRHALPVWSGSEEASMTAAVQSASDGVKLASEAETPSTSTAASDRSPTVIAAAATNLATQCRGSVDFGLPESSFTFGNHRTYDPVDRPRLLLHPPTAFTRPKVELSASPPSAATHTALEATTERVAVLAGHLGCHSQQHQPTPPPPPPCPASHSPSLCLDTANVAQVGSAFRELMAAERSLAKSRRAQQPRRAVALVDRNWGNSRL